MFAWQTNNDAFEPQLIYCAVPKLCQRVGRERVRLTHNSGRTIKQVADDLGIGFSTPTRWKGKQDEAALLSGPHDDVGRELKRLRRENDILRQERDLLKKATVFFARNVIC